MLETIIPIVIIALILFFAIRYIVKSKKRGDKCIGCPMAGSCQKHGKTAMTRGAQ